MSKYGKADKYQFDDPTKWYTEHSVPLLDEHEMSDEEGNSVAQVDRRILEEIAHNNNQRVHLTGDPATLILGHTSDDPRAEEKPAKGFVVNYHVKPFKRDPKTGQVIYAIHGDYKVRPHNKKLLEEYPRRSVELWWHKKELDPIAMLGGSSPERDLGVVIRNGRINHISINKYPASNSIRQLQNQLNQEVIKFRTRGNFTIETYSLPDVQDLLRYNKMEKVMSEYKEGSLHSGSKKGPKVTSRDQAIAIGLSEARKHGETVPNKKAKGEHMGKPERYEEECDYDNPKMKYDDGSMNTDELNEYDAGDEGVPHDSPSDEMMGEEDPMIARVMQSKQFKDMQSKIDMMFNAIMGAEQGGEGQGEMGEGMPEGEMNEMPPPQDGMQSPPPGAEGMGEGYPEEPEEDERRMHGEQPVQMSADSTGFAGPTDTYIPSHNTGKSRKPHQMSRNGKYNMNRNGTRTRQNPEVIRMQREVQSLKLRYARSEAANIMKDLVAENIRFGRSDQEHAEGIKEEEEYLVALLMEGTEDDISHHINNVIRKKYSRSRPNPASPTQVGVARYTRVETPPKQNETEDDENFEDTLIPSVPTKDPDLTKVSEFAEVQMHFRRQGKNSGEARKEAIKFMRKKYNGQ